ncbi:hypothetical protein H5158_19620 [Pseudoalteromonas sp. SR45-6]|uniref:hypothetical protein n=1 Tax=Pseudoalteromonas sp. SR45-6 TaxID=2760927 RepID=UPI00160173A6|nr:hypothetical protein [Pseudoalteromonas sp. SR45-6]MBB1343823.1 hypothetical protein [Pseudoalteromonas sp. SR45-6]
MFSFKISFKLSHNKVNTDKTKIRLLESKDVYLMASDEEARICDTDSLLVLGSNYKNYREAAIDMVRVEQAIKMSALSEYVGISVSNDGHEDYPQNVILREMEKPFLGSGLMFKQLVFRRVYETTTNFYDPNMSCEVELIQCDNFIKQCNKYYENYDYSFELSSVIEILNNIKFEYSSKVRLILSMTVVEMLSDSKVTRTEEEIKMIDSFVNEIEDSNIDKNKKQSLRLAIEGCKNLSISNACKKLVKSKLGRKRAEDFYRLYNYRSRVVHSGGLDDSIKDDEELQAEIYKAAGEANLLASDLVDAVLEEHLNDGEPQFMEL